MTPKEFAAFLESPESDQFSVEQIKNMLQQYPYVQSLRIAFLKKLRSSNHPNFEKYLHKTATYAYDRVFLKRYVNKKRIYVIEYPAMKIEAEQLETLELIPLDKLQGEKVEQSIFDDMTGVPEQSEQLTFQSNDWEEPIQNETEETTETEIENIEEPIQNEVTEIVETVQNETEETTETEIENTEEPIQNEVTEIVESTKENTAKTTSNSELQNIILESKKMEQHAPIEEDIDNLLHEDYLETLDDEIEFGFEIDKTIINNHDDFSLFDHNEQTHESKNEEHVINKSEKPLHEQIHEQINAVDQQESGESDDKNELTSEDLSSKIEDEKEAIIGKITLTETKKDPEELPLEQEEAFSTSTENVDKIRATLSSKIVDKQTKKQQIKAALERISKIPLHEIGVITETFGDLLAKQGKIEHAIRLYQELILKNPQKKVYFAAKIKQLIKRM